MMSNQIQTHVVNDIASYMQLPQVMEQFEAVIGGGANVFVQSCLLVIARSKKLQQCSYRSLASSMLEAASLRLSCVPSLRQGHLIPRSRRVNDPVKGWITIQEAHFLPHYLGLYNLAMRTGQYAYLNVIKIYEGERVLEDVDSGLHYIEAEGMIIIPGKGKRGRDVTKLETRAVIGWLGKFITKDGTEKTVYQSCDELELFAREHSDAYKYDLAESKQWSPWSRPGPEREIQEMKTVFRKLMGWADLTGQESGHLRQAIEGVDVKFTEPDVIPAIPSSTQMDAERAAEIDGVFR